MPSEKEAIAPTQWLAPSLQVQWGPYFRPDPLEQKAIVEMTNAALGAGGGPATITLRAAVQKIAPIFGIDNVDAAIEALKKESDEKAEKALKIAQATKPAAGSEPVADDAKSSADTPPPAKPKKDDL